MSALMQRVQDANDYSTVELSRLGYDSSAFKMQLVELQKPKDVTVPHTQERAEALAEATTHGERFVKTGGGPLTSDDFFKSFEIPRQEREINAMEKEKVHHLALLKNKNEAKELLRQPGRECGWANNSTSS